MARGKIALAAASAAMLAFVLASFPVLARTGSDSPATAAGEKRTTVRVMDNFFDPRSAGVGEAGKVTFRWKGDNRHNVRFTQVPPGARKKGSKARREGRWSRKFFKPGLYRYACTLFAGMRGTITVKPPTSGEGG